MANTYEAVLDNVVNSDAKYQAFIQSYEAALLASGFLELAPDTGQINPLTVTRPSVSTYSGFRIYRAKDSLAATKPLYIKIEYGLASVNDRMQIRKTTAIGSNGSGTLTGTTLAAAVYYTPSTSGSGVSGATIYGGGGPHAAFVFTYDPGQINSHTTLYAVGRLLDQSNGAVGDPVIWDMVSNAGSTNLSTYWWTDGIIAWAQPSGGISMLGADVSSAIHTGSDIGVFRLFELMIYRTAKTWVMPFLTGKVADLPFTTPLDSKFISNVWGGNHTFLPLPQPAMSSGGNRLAFLWE